jgi:mycothiol synthase
MLRLRATPPEVHEALASSDAVRRLVSGDALDQAMYGFSLLAMVIRDARELGATSLEIDVEGAGDVHTEMADANHLTPTRELLKMWRELPATEPWDLDVRPFRVGEDEPAWLEVNNRAFAWHPEQHGWTIETIQAKEAEPWFDPDGFLLHEREGRLAGFCWTKIHADERPPLGEIFVIAVDPDFHGLGLGRPLVLAGLDWLADRDLRNAILYVEATNAPAVAVYEKLGFTVIESHRWWTIDLTA